MRLLAVVAFVLVAVFETVPCAVDAFVSPLPSSSIVSHGAGGVGGGLHADDVVGSGKLRSGGRRVRPLLNDAQSNGDDYLDNFNEDDDEEEEEEDKLDSLIGKKLGINIGSQLPSLTPDEIADIKAAAQSALDEAVDARLADIETLRDELQDELQESRKRMDTAASLNVQLEKQNLMEKIDRISDEFLSGNEDFRAATKRAADADRLAGEMGRGVDWGSWGSMGDGGEVVVSGAGGGGARAGKVLLGSVDSARRRNEMLLAQSGGGGEDGSELEDMAAAARSEAAVENRILVVVDDKKDKGAAPILSRLAELLDEAFDSNIVIDAYDPYSSNVPIGGNNAQAAIVFASSLNDRSSLESILGRVLKRTAPVAGGTPGMPPSHVVVVSALGTERTNKMPYSMQNLFGGKLDKLREIEQGVASVSRSRIAGKQLPLDYTVVKFGDVLAASDEDAKDAAGGSVAIKPGDSLDGEIGPNAAANVLAQALAYQPYARNSTLCATGCLPSDASIDASAWNDAFLCLSGPELLRVEAGPGADGDGSAVLDPKFEQLRQYVKQWSMNYEGDRKGTGLTTPVLVRKSRKLPSKFDGVEARSGVRILFQTTNTGDRYKSATEEKREEKERSSVTKKAPATTNAKPIITKAQKEGGVEVLVEKTTEGNIRVRARRCNVDNKTIVKEMSEEVIVKSLKSALQAWVEARSTTGF